MTILIDLAAEFTGKKAFKQADTATEKLTKSAKSLAKTFGVAFGTAAVLGYAKASVKAAAADQKAQKQLALALKNVGLERDAASAESYIQRLQSEFGVVDDLLRPSYQQLAVATRNSAEAQRLMGLALDLSASTGKDLSSVTGALSKAYLGNNTALTRLGVGISKADLKTKSFKEITDELAKTFKGSAAASAATFAGSMAKLGVASENVKEIIGTGIIDALTTLSNDKTVDNLATSMEDLATYTADVIRGIGILTNSIKNIPGLGGLNGAAIVQAIPILGSYITLLNEAGRKARQVAEVGAQKNPIQAGTYLATQKKVTALTKEQQKAQSKILTDKKLGLAIDKANLALGKATDVFDLDKIQLNAAMINQSEQLGKVTSQAQLLALTNDVARIKVKQDILALEDAIASKNVEAITAATNQLNTDLGILGVLSGQKLKLTEIATILGSLAPKALIDQDDLNLALEKIRTMMALLASMNKGGGTSGGTSGGNNGGNNGGDTTTTTKKDGGGQMDLGAPKLPKNTSTAAIVAATLGGTGLTATGFGAAKNDTQAWAKELADKAAKDAAAAAAVALTDTIGQASFTQGIGAGLTLAQSLSGARYAAQGAAQMGGGYVININTGIGDPNAIAETIDQYLQGAVDRGTLRVR